MEIGKKIRELRIARNLTQEALAAELSVTPQAISKWECGTTTPDIQLLPDIAIFFGVTLDELFCLTDDNELDRIQNQIWDSRLLPQAELERAERFLQSRIEAGYRPGRCWCLRAQLHNHQAQQHHALAAEYARQALAVSPTEKDAHSELCEATGGTFGDWCVHNHARRIAYYREFVAAHPDYPRGYLWLLDDLIADGRLTEARGYLEKWPAWTIATACRSTAEKFCVPRGAWKRRVPAGLRWRSDSRTNGSSACRSAIWRRSCRTMTRPNAITAAP